VSSSVPRALQVLTDPVPHQCLQEFMEGLYDRIINNEIKMKDEGLPGMGGAAASAQQAAAASAGW